MKVLVIFLLVIGISLSYSGISEADARTVNPLYIILEDDTIKQNSFITADNGVPVIMIQKEQTLSFPLKVISTTSEPLPVNFIHSVEYAMPETRRATLPDMKIEFEPFSMVLKPDESQILNVTITTMNYTQLGEHRITVTAQYPQGEPLLNTGFDVLVIDVDKNPCFNKTLNQPKPCSPETSLEFYKFMGEEWMESKKQEMLDAYQADMFHEWIDQTENHYNWNVYQYYSYTEDLTKFLLHPNPHKQYEIGVEYHKIKCNNNLILIQKYDGSPACVKPESEWKLIERGWTTTDFAKEKITIKEIVGAKILDMSFDDKNKSILIQIDSFSDGHITVTIPRNVLDAKIHGEDDDFFILVDGKEVDFEETRNATERTFTVSFEKGSKGIEITIPILI